MSSSAARPGPRPGPLQRCAVGSSPVPRAARSAYAEGWGSLSCPRERVEHRTLKRQQHGRAHGARCSVPRDPTATRGHGRVRCWLGPAWQPQRPRWTGSSREALFLGQWPLPHRWRYGVASSPSPLPRHAPRRRSSPREGRTGRRRGLCAQPLLSLRPRACSLWASHWVSLPLFHSALLRMHSGRLLTTSTGRQPARVTVSGGKWEEGRRRVQGGRSTRPRGPGRA